MPTPTGWAAFAYCNHLGSQQQIDTIMYTKFVAMNCPYFDFRSCSFSERNMSIKDKNGESKEGSNRVALYRSTNLVHIYTIETNYSCASLTTAVTDATDGTKTLSPSYKVQSRKSSPIFLARSKGPPGWNVGRQGVESLQPPEEQRVQEHADSVNWASSYINASVLSKKFKSLSALSPKKSSAGRCHG